MADMNITCLDLEGVLVPEIWIAFADASGIPELRKTTRDEPDYDKLMKYRLAILKEHGLGLKQIQETIAIHLYDVQDDHISTCDWYTVDRYTAQGYNVLEEPVALVGGAVEETAPAESTEAPTEDPTDVPTDVPAEGVPVA